MSEGEGTVKVLEEEISAVVHAEMKGVLQPAPTLLPGEIDAHPTPFKYVMIFLILVVVTAIEVGTSYLEGSVTSGVIVAMLLFWAIVKFALVAAYYMHLKTDQPMFRRFFVLGIIAACVLYAVALTSLHVF
ncbi:MAG: cytochrome C oxidase subunit IV family protein [Actinomycetota bacterium]